MLTGTRNKISLHLILSITGSDIKHSVVQYQSLYDNFIQYCDIIMVFLGIHLSDWAWFSKATLLMFSKDLKA